MEAVQSRETSPGMNSRHRRHLKKPAAVQRSRISPRQEPPGGQAGSSRWKWGCGCQTRCVIPAYNKLWLVLSGKNQNQGRDTCLVLSQKVIIAAAKSPSQPRLCRGPRLHRRRHHHPPLRSGARGSPSRGDEEGLLGCFSHPVSFQGTCLCGSTEEQIRAAER